MPGPHHPRLTLLATILASSLAFIDGSVVNVALPAIGRDLQASAADLQWTINAYLLPLSALLLLGGAAGDHFGRRRMLIGGIALFAAASLACALAPGLELLLAARVVQGIGAAMLMPNSLSILSYAFSGEEKGRAVGTWAAVGAIASAFGPPLGGWLVEAVGWRSIFYINLPVAALAIGLALKGVEESGDGKQPLDWAGAGLATVALGALTWALTLWSSKRVMTEQAWVALGLGIVTLALFVLVEHRRRDRAMMPLALFGTRAFVGLTAYTFLLYGALGGLILLLPYVLITGGGYSPLQAGLALLPFSFAVGLGSRLMGGLTGRIGPRWPLTIGPSIVAAGFALMLLVGERADYWTHVLPGMLAIALGMAAAVAPLTTAVLSSVDDEHTGTASGFNSAIARTGGLIATASCGAVIAASGPALIDAFHVAALAGAGLAAGAALSAFASLGSAAR
ncbi:MFS transporter [Sphingomonas sp.]|uniref:MFS transporter n=1 Tax=Sphingomonas sp. TaxID=28214 RepID=UPI0025FEF395|nr:MFS transporter [Sphingomonas sp.]